MMQCLMDKISHLEIDEIIMAGAVIKTINIENWHEFSIKNIEDARSAAFYALGRAKVTEKPVALFVEAAYVASTYTAITEAFYQKVPVLIVSFDYKRTFCEESFMRYSVSTIYNITNIEHINEIRITNKPVLVKICLEEEKINRKAHKTGILERLLLTLNETLLPQDEVLLYADDVPCNFDDGITIRQYSAEYQYGVISKYLGMLQYAEHELILMIPEQMFRLDYNVFNSRYITPKMKIIVYDVQDENNIKLEWLTYNKIQCYNGAGMIAQMIHSEHASISFLNGRLEYVYNS